MGEVITKQAAVEDIAADLDTTLVNAAARGGMWAKFAEEMVRPSVDLLAEIELEVTATSAAVTRLTQDVEVRDDEADALLAAGYDEIYNLAGRPGNDVILSLLYPGGSSAYTGAATAEQPVHMNMLARLLERRLHPAIPADRALAMAAEVRVAARRLREAVQALAGPAAELAMLTTMRSVLARAGQVQLVRLKRTWKGQGASEADIHQVIPDRPRPRKPKGAGSAGAAARASEPRVDAADADADSDSDADDANTGR